MKQIFILKEGKNITSPNDLFNKIKKFKIDHSQENFILIYLNTKNKIIGSEVLFKGGVNSCIIDPKIIFRKALSKKNINSLIIAHNHPSKNLKPSDEDKHIYEILKKGGKILDLKVLDSIIFNKKEYYSLNVEN